MFKKKRLYFVSYSFEDVSGAIKIGSTPLIVNLLDSEISTDIIKCIEEKFPKYKNIVITSISYLGKIK